MPHCPLEFMARVHEELAQVFSALKEAEAEPQPRHLWLGSGVPTATFLRFPPSAGNVRELRIEQEPNGRIVITDSVHDAVVVTRVDPGGLLELGDGGSTSYQELLDATIERFLRVQFK